MTTSVLRYRCDLCGAIYPLNSQAHWCEKMCAEIVAQAIEAQRAGTTKIGPVVDESAVAASDAPKGESRG